MKKSTILFVISILLISATSFGQEIAKSQPLMIYLFSSSTCEKCQKLKKEFLPQILKKFQGVVVYQYIPVDDEIGFKLQLMYEQHYDCSSDEAVKLFIGKQCLSGINNIQSRLEAAIIEESNNQAVTITPSQMIMLRGSGQENNSAIERFSAFTPGVVALAGIIDGINPCAFITIVFFVSVLFLLKKTKRETLIVGGFFTLSVFLTYLLLGLGAFRIIKVFSVNSGIAHLISLIAVLLVFCLAVYNFIDYLRYKNSNNIEDIKIKLPKVIRKLINHLIRSKMQTKNLILSSIILGFVVSLLESMCTGQVYLPTIVYIFQQKEMLLKPFSYLCLYNTMFIMPLLIVFGFAYFGMSSVKISKFFSQHLAIAKLLLAILFLVLAIFLVLSGV